MKIEKVGTTPTFLQETLDLNQVLAMLSADRVGCANRKTCKISPALVKAKATSILLSSIVSKVNRTRTKEKGTERPGTIISCLLVLRIISN